MKLYVVRHGETEWNVEGRLQGHLDSPLTPNGIRQAQLLAEKLSSVTLDSITSSPSGRAIQTVKILKGNRPVSVQEDNRLLEIHHGSWQGKKIEEIKAVDRDQHEIYVKQPHLFQPKGEGAESLFDVLDRVEDFLMDLENRYDRGNHLIVTHGVVVKLLQMICKQNSMKQIWEPPHIDGTSLTIIETDKGVRKLLLEGDVSHKFV